MALNLNEVQVILYIDIYSMVYLANLFMNANCFVDSLEFFQIQNQAICKYSFTYSIHTLVNFIYFSYLTSMARTTSTMLNKVARVVILIVSLILGGKFSVFHH